jgi:hypothetical protein
MCLVMAVSREGRYTLSLELLVSTRPGLAYRVTTWQYQ